MMYTCSPAMNGLNIHVHVLSCAGPPRTVQVEICRQLTIKGHILCLDIKLLMPSLYVAQIIPVTCLRGNTEMST